MDLEIQNFDVREEMNIAIGMIISNKYIEEIRPIYRKGYMKSPYLDFLVEACIEYYDKYSKAPGRAIRTLFDQKKKKINDPEFIKSIEDFFLTLNEMYSDLSEDPSFNAEYYLDLSREYFQKRTLEITSKDVLFLLEKNKVEDAKELIDGISERMITELRVPLNQVSIEGVLSMLKNSDGSDILFSMAPRFSSYGNKIEALMGPFKRGHLVSFMGPMKSGKSFLLMESAFQAVESGMKVLFISLEMSKVDIESRIMTRLSGRLRKKTNINQTLFDCMKNQNGSCELPYRENDITLDSGTLDSPITKGNAVNKLKVALSNMQSKYVDPDYQRCDYCRTRERLRGNFQLAFHRENFDLDEWSNDLLMKQAEAFSGIYSSNFFYVCHPCYTTSVNDIIEEVNRIRLMYNFIPDLVVIDYADLLSSSTRQDSLRNQLNDIWQSLKSLAQTKNINVTTATQTNRQGMEKDTFGTVNLAEDIRKAGTVDSLIGIQCSDIEREYGLIRLNCLLHRHQRFNEKRFLVCCQNLYVSQPILDAEWLTS